MNEIRSGGEQDRNENRQFLPGVSGNLNGRPPGRVDKRVRLRDELLGSDNKLATMTATSRFSPYTLRKRLT
jgi:hypothetical protein